MSSDAFSVLPVSGGLNRARIIRAHDAASIIDATDIVEQARRHAEQIVASAQHAADDIVEKAHAQAHDILTSTRIHAEANSKALLDQARQQATREAVNLVNDAMRQVRAEIDSTDELIIRLVERLMLTLLNEFAPSDLLAHLVRVGIADLREQFGLILRVNPADETMAQDALAKIHEGSNHSVIERIETSAELEPGDYHLVSVGGLLDLSLKNQISNLVEGLRVTSLPSAAS